MSGTFCHDEPEQTPQQPGPGAGPVVPDPSRSPRAGGDPVSRRAARPGSLAVPTRLRVRRPSDFLAVIPYLVGFHPDESVVALLFRHGRVLLTARIDLPPPELAEELSTHLHEVSGRHQVEELVLAAYSRDLTGARRVVERVVADPPAPVRDALLIGGGRWWSLTCPSGCCPEEGSPYDPAGHPLAAEAVYAGLNVERDRFALAERVSGPPPAAEAPLLARVAPLRQRVAALGTPGAARLMAETVQRLRADPEPVDEDCLLLAVLAEDLVVRDVAWAMMHRRDSEDDVRVWGRVVARAPRGVAAGPLGLLGAAAWISGNGALQNCCVERLELLDPSYSLGGLLADISERALPPSAWDDMAEDLRREVCAVAGLHRLH